MTPRSAAANRRLREDARRRIFHGSLAVFSDRGFDGASIAEIAERAGVSKGLIYHYFDSKTELLVTALRWRVRSLLALTEVLDDLPEPRARLGALASGILDGVEEDPDFYRFYLGLTLGTPGPELAAAFAEVAEPLDRYLSRVRRVFVDAGSADPDLDALLFRSALLGLAIRLAARDPAAGQPGIVERLLDLHLPDGGAGA